MKKVMLFTLVTVIGLMSMTTPVAPISFKVDATKSTFKWTAKKVTGSHWGYIKFTDGTILVDKGVLVGGTFNVDMTTMDCQDLQGEYAGKLMGHLKSDDFFGVEKFPKSTLVIKKTTAKGNSQYDVVADLTIKGITKEINFPANVTVTGQSITAQANFNINRTQFDIKYGSGSFFSNLGDKAINDEFGVEINISGAADAIANAATKKAAKKTTKKAAKSSK
jgi:polyisoprenoid-binding protein YceI